MGKDENTNALDINLSVKKLETTKMNTNISKNVSSSSQSSQNKGKKPGSSRTSALSYISARGKNVQSKKSCCQSTVYGGKLLGIIVTFALFLFLITSIWFLSKSSIGGYQKTGDTSTTMTNLVGMDMETFPGTHEGYHDMGGGSLMRNPDGNAPVPKGYHDMGDGMIMKDHGEVSSKGNTKGNSGDHEEIGGCGPTGSPNATNGTNGNATNVTRGNVTKYGITLDSVGYDVLLQDDKLITLTASEKAQIKGLNVAMPCCGYATLDPDNNCGCGHHVALLGLTKRLVKQGYTYDAIQQEIDQWKKVFYPSGKDGNAGAC